METLRLGTFFWLQVETHPDPPSLARTYTLPGLTTTVDTTLDQFASGRKGHFQGALPCQIPSAGQQPRGKPQSDISFQLRQNESLVYIYVPQVYSSLRAMAATYLYQTP